MRRKEIYVSSADIDGRLCHRSIRTQISSVYDYQRVTRKNEVPLIGSGILRNKMRRPGTACLLIEQRNERRNTARWHFTQTDEIGIEGCDPRGRAIVIL